MELAILAINEVTLRAALSVGAAFLLSLAIVSGGSLLRASRKAPSVPSPAAPPEWGYEDFEKVEESEDTVVYRVGKERRLD